MTFVLFRRNLRRAFIQILIAAGRELGTQESRLRLNKMLNANAREP